MNSQDIARLRSISPQEFALWGIQDIAYIRSVTVDGQRAFEIHAADGTPVAVMKSLELAQAAVRQNDLEPLSIH
jgi:hypothetical protein